MRCSKILILGITGMLGHILFSELSLCNNLDVYGTLRFVKDKNRWFSKDLSDNIYESIDTSDLNLVDKVISELKPDFVINCIGLVKQLPISKDPIQAITINALFPHKLAYICKNNNSKLIHFSTDCVFDGKKGEYIESDQSNAEDLYGKTKFLGEVNNNSCITIRTSLIGHELKNKHGLVEWFISQKSVVKGFTNAIFSGFPTIEIASIIKRFILPEKNLNGLYHLSSKPISKYNLLKLIADIYNKKIEIIPYEDYYIDRSLDSTKFKKLTGYRSPEWVTLIKKMYKNFKNSKIYHGGKI